MTNTIRIRLFAQFREKLGRDFWEVSISSPIRVEQLRSRLGEEIPELLALLSRSSFAVNHEIAAG